MTYEIKEGFCNLHQHTTESHLDAMCDIDELFDRVKELGQKAVAVTDHGSMGGIYKAWKASKRTGVKLIPGNEIYLVLNTAAESKNDDGWDRYHLVLLAYNEVGYRNLLRINYEGFRHSIHIPIAKKTFSRIDFETLSKYSEGLFCLSACGGNIIARHLQKGDKENAEKYASQLKDIFGGRFYIELQPHEMKRKGMGQVELNDAIREVALKLDIPMVATCDAHYVTPDDEKYHDMLLAISDGKSLEDLSRHTYTSDTLCSICDGNGFLNGNKKDKCPNEQCVNGIISKTPCVEFYVKSQDELVDFFTRFYGKEEALKLVENASKIADACEQPDYIDPGTQPHIPKFNLPHIEASPDKDEFKAWRAKAKLESIPDDYAYLRFWTWKGFHEYCKNKSKEDKDKYWTQLKFEISVLEAKGFVSYMLIVADYIRWAKDNGIPTGPGRGSGCGSIAGFFMGIHKVDSIKYGLLFERFINLEKKAYPDYDIDFAPSGRDKVIKYVQNKYGEANVAFISNLNRFTPKVLLKDIVRSLMIGGNKSAAFNIANNATSDIPNKVHLEDGRIIEIDTIDLVLKHATDKHGFRQLIEEHPEIIDFARAILKLPRNYSTHAAGVVISDVPLYEIAPVRRDKDGQFAVQYEKNAAEENNLIKMDFLGLKTLDILGETYRGAKELALDVYSLDELVEHTDDEGAYKLINSGNVLGCFQLEGGTLKNLCPVMKAQSIEDISFINALGRPGIDKEKRKLFLERRHGRASISAVHPVLSDITNKTLGISVYDEDLLRIAQAVAGWNLSKADGLRKLTKLKEKGADLAEKLAKEFVDDAEKYGKVSRQDAQYIWDTVISDYAKYGFCKAHSIAYSLLGYMTAYYKWHARAPFFAAALNSELGGSQTPEGKEYVEDLKKECKRFGVSIDVCDINKSKKCYVAADAKRIVTGINAVAGIGDEAQDAIIANQPYSSYEEFVFKNLRFLKRPHVEALAKAGAFDQMGLSRKFVHDHFADLKKEMQKFLKKTYPEYFEKDDEKLNPRPGAISGFKYSKSDQNAEEWTLQEKLSFEKQVIGEFISGGVADLYPGFFKNGVNDQQVSTLTLLSPGTEFIIEGLIASFKELTIKKPGRNLNKVMAFATLETLKGESLEFTAFANTWEKLRPKLGETVTPFRAKLVVNEYQGKKTFVLTDTYTIYSKSGAK
jgi:DNA polymerase III subunit alpha